MDVPKLHWQNLIIELIRWLMLLLGNWVLKLVTPCPRLQRSNKIDCNLNHFSWGYQASTKPDTVVLLCVAQKGTGSGTGVWWLVICERCLVVCKLFFNVYEPWERSCFWLPKCDPDKAKQPEKTRPVMGGLTVIELYDYFKVFGSLLLFFKPNTFKIL